MKYFIFKSSVISAAIMTLAACGVTTGSETTPVSASIFRDGASGTPTLKKVDASYSKDTSGKVTLIHDGKTYTFTDADLVDSNPPKKYLKIFGDITLTFKENISNGKFTVWSVDFENSLANYNDRGWAVFGDRTQSMPTSKVTTYNGSMFGYSVNKANGMQIGIDGTSQLITDFNTNKITGNFNLTRTYDYETGANVSAEFDKITITNGEISGNTFNGGLTLTNGGTAVPVTSGAIEGGFYGEENNGLGVAGVGQLETSDSVTTFGFGAE